MGHFRRLASAALAAAFVFSGLAPGAARASVAAVAVGLPAAWPAALADGLGFNTPPTCLVNTSSFSNSTSQAIPDSSIVTSTINVTATGGLWELWVTTDIVSDYSGALSVTLTSPGGTPVSLTTGNGGNNDNVFHGTTWRDDAGEINAPGPVTLAAFANNVPETPLAPEEPLGAFRGEDPNGVWTLRVAHTGTGHAGTLVSWGLSLAGANSPSETILEGSSNSNSVNIPDNGTPVSIPITLTEATASLVSMVLTTTIAHPKSNDLVIELVPPSGVTITLASHQGGPNADVFNGTQWYDDAGDPNPPGAVTDSAFFTGTLASPLAPQEPLSAANGSPPAGQWVLRVADTNTNGITGKVDGFTLDTTSYICRPLVNLGIQVPEIARLDAPIPMWLQVGNSIISVPVGQVELTATLPISGHFISAAGAGWGCAGPAVGALGGTLLCTRAAGLATGELSTVTVQISPPPVPEYLGEIEAGVSVANQIDPETESERVFAGAHSASQNQWDVVENRIFPDGDEGLDTGGVDDGGQDAFDEWGDLRLRVFDGGGLLAATPLLEHFGLLYSAGHRWRTTTPVAVTDTIQVAREIYAPETADWLRYVDTFTNTGLASRTVWVAWGGNLGSDSDTLVNASSSGDADITAVDTWAVTIENDDPVPEDPPVGYAWRSPADTTYQGTGSFYTDPFTTTWPSSGNDELGYNFKLDLAPGASASLAYFVYRGLAEGVPGPQDCKFYGDCYQPADGSQVARAQAKAAALVLQPNFCDLTPAEFSKIVNWPGKEACGAVVFLPVVKR